MPFLQTTFSHRSNLGLSFSKPAKRLPVGISFLPGIVSLCLYLQFEFISQHLVFANCIPLILKFLNQNISAFISAKNT